MIYSNFMLADNKRGVTLKFGSTEGEKNNTAVLKSSYITALSRPDCAECYGDSAISCSDNIALRMLTVSANGNTLPFYGLNYDSISKQAAFDHKALLHDVTFDSYRQSYSGALSSTCKSNFVFRPHDQAYDSVAEHSLYNCKCNNCDQNSYAKCDSVPSSISGCGGMSCTGKSNYLIRDMNGTFLPSKGVIIPSNLPIGNNEAGCTYSQAMNGHICFREDFATLYYQSIAKDYRSRIVWPVKLTADGLNYSTLTNGFREWEWSAKGVALNRRYGRFNSIIRLNYTYNMTFAASPPTDL